jgi:hypothetical protein
MCIGYLVPLVLFQGLRPAGPFGRPGGLRTGFLGNPNPLRGGQTETRATSSIWEVGRELQAPVIEITHMLCRPRKLRKSGQHRCCGTRVRSLQAGPFGRPTWSWRRKLGEKPTKSKCSHALLRTLRSGLTSVPVTSPDKCRVGLVLGKTPKT